MKKFKRFLYLSIIGCMLIGNCLYAGAATVHVHDYHVVGKNLVSVRQGYTHEYISGIKTDPFTGVATAVYSTCTVLKYVYQGTYTCTVCGATLPNPYTYPTEEKHSSCNG